MIFSVFWFGLRSVWNGVFDLRGQIAAKKIAMQSAQENLKKLNSSSKILESNKNNVEKLEQAVPSDVLMPEIINMLESLASQNGLALKDINITLPQEEARRVKQVKVEGEEVAAAAVSPIKIIKLDIQASGTYSAFKNWLKTVETSLRILDVSNISFRLVEKKSSSGEVIQTINPLINFSVSLDTYVLKK